MTAPAPTQAAAAQPAPRPRNRRRRGWIALGVVASFLIAAYLTLPWQVRFEQGVSPRLGAESGLTVPEYGPDGMHFLDYQHGETITVTVALTNRGPIPVSVTDVRLTDEVQPLVDVHSATAEGVALPTTIAPGETVPVVLAATFGNCRYYHERNMQSMPGAIVRGDVLSRSFREVATFDRPLALHAQGIQSCPDRTLTRDDDVRGEPPAPGRGHPTG